MAKPKNRPEVFDRELLFEELFRKLPKDSAYDATPYEYLEILEGLVQAVGTIEGDFIKLFEIADQFGVTYDQAKRAHLSLFRRLVEAAWEDKRLSPTERSELEHKAKLLGIGSDAVLGIIENQAPEGTLPFGLKIGDSVVLTGDMTPPKSEMADLLAKFGVEVKTGVSKKTSFVVAADTNSFSGKSQKARELGIPIYSAVEVHRAFSELPRPR
jgi:DNA polymerase-3 subunit epsilon